ncbi:MAG: aminotransferase class V-fold PLP-dependent enzyme [Candidatus Promineifilaceae bacterium]
MTQLDYNFIRQQFPAFSEPSLDGFAFFQNAGGSYACGQVIDRLNRYYRETKMQPGSFSPASTRGAQLMDESHVRLAAYMNIGVDEIHFGPSTSINTYVLSHAFRPMWEDGDEIIVTNQDHEANSGAWRRMANTGIVVREWAIGQESGVLDLADLDELLNERTRLVVFPHCSNVVGHINDVAAITAKVKATTNAFVLVDGVAYAPHGFPDIQELGVDAYLFSMYKTYGPHQGLMVVRRHLLDQVANQSHYFNSGYTRKKINPAGPDHAQVAAAQGVADYFDAVYAHHFSEDVDSAEKGRRLHKLFRDAESTHIATIFDWLKQRDDLTIVGPSDVATHAATLSVTLHNKSSAFVAREMAEHRVGVANGDFYGVRVLDGMGIPLDPGVLRISFVHYTTDAEVQQLLKALDAVL